MRGHPTSLLALGHAIALGAAHLAAEPVHSLIFYNMILFHKSGVYCVSELSVFVLFA